jgi:hypothetical protein
MMLSASNDLEGPLTQAEFQRLARLSRLPLAWTASVRRRRLLLLGLAGPGFLAVFATPIHQTFLVLIGGILAFVAALIFRSRSERVFVRAEAAALWPPIPPSKEIPDA